MKKRIILSALLLIPWSVTAFDYPTEEIVRNVIDCMSVLGGSNDPNLYTCTCREDYIMGHMKYQEYDNAATWDRNKQMPGDKGATVRDMELGKRASKKYEKVMTEAEGKCPVVRHIEAPKHKASE